MTDKQTIIQNVYFDPAGFDGIKKTFEEARKKDKTITYNIVKEWFEKIQNKRNN